MSHTEIVATEVRSPTFAAPRRSHDRVLRRPEQGRIIAGVCAGLAVYFDRSVWLVRLIFGALGLLFGIGVLLYLFWWVTIPSGDPGLAELAAQPAALGRLAPRLKSMAGARILQRREVVTGLLLLGTAAVALAIRHGWDWQRSWLPPVGLTLGGLTLAWSQADAANRAFDDASDGSRRGTATRLLGGVALLVVGVLMVFGHETPNWAMIQSAAAAVAVLIGVGLVFAPWWLRLIQALGDERAARVRAAERADIAAHLHDSVLQTLALIRSNANDADAVARLSRAQERELREWLYTDRAVPGTSFATEMRSLIAQVEDGKIGKTGAPATAIDLVVVGDCQPTEATDALLQATREALVNAVTHGQPPVSVYLEIADDVVEVFVRDRGPGFDPIAIASDRLGVRESIIGRMKRRGGSAEVVSRPDWGTEVRLKLPRTGG